MNGKRILAILIVMLILLLSAGQVTGQEDKPQSSQGTYGYAFTYQGQLKDAGGPVNGTCDLRFSLWDAASGGWQAGSTLTLEGVEIKDGLFTARLDFGSGAHGGAARWLEVSVRCPAGSGAYVTLSPRQELTGAPAALSLVLPFTAEANLGGPLAWFENNGDGEAAGFSSQAGSALWVDHSGLNGLHVASAGQDGVQVVNAGASGLAVDTAGGDGIFVNTAHNNGLKVNAADHNGVQVDSTGGDGVYVGSAGSPSTTIVDDRHNGFEVAGAEGNGLWVGRADVYGVVVGSAGSAGVFVGPVGGDGVHVNWAGGDGMRVHLVGGASTVTPSDSHNGFEVAGAEGNGLYVGRADGDGVFVDSAGGTGVYVGSTGFSGMHVDSAGYDGVVVHEAGDPSTAVYNAQNNGFEVAGAQGHGLYVGRADDTGVFVHSAGWNGVVVEEAGGDGVRATATVYNALYGDTANAQGEWGLYTPDKIHAQNVTLQTLTLVAQVTGPDALSPGDIVAAAGVAPPLLDNGEPLPLVRLAAAEWNGVVGVVEGRLALTPIPQPGGEEQRLELRSAAGPARPGDYVALTVFGLAQVKVDSGRGIIQPGMRLTGGAGGSARVLKTVVVEGVTLAESAPNLGMALAAPDENGLVWVLVNPQ